MAYPFIGGPPLDAGRLIMYAIELRDVAGMAADYWLVLHQAASEWLAAEDALDVLDAQARSDETARTEALQRQRTRQGVIFRAAEAMLGSYARTSLLLFPTAGLDSHYPRPERAVRRDWRLNRGQILRKAIGIDETHAIANRDLRNDWMHHDERLDDQMIRRVPAGSQRFERAGKVPANLRGTYFRLFEIGRDDVTISMRGASHSLLNVGKALEDVWERAARHYNLWSVAEEESK